MALLAASRPAVRPDIQAHQVLLSGHGRAPRHQRACCGRCGLSLIPDSAEQARAPAESATDWAPAPRTEPAPQRHSGAAPVTHPAPPGGATGGRLAAQAMPSAPAYRHPGSRSTGHHTAVRRPHGHRSQAAVTPTRDSPNRADRTPAQPLTSWPPAKTSRQANMHVSATAPWTIADLVTGSLPLNLPLARAILTSSKFELEL
jgi:hypothetical protein